MSAAVTPPVVTVLDNTVDGVVVHWFSDLAEANTNSPSVTATRHGVYLGYGVSLTCLPDAWTQAARQAHETLRAGGDVSHLATHRGRFGDSGGPLDPVDE